MTTEVKLPELGENIETAEILSILVSSGDAVEKDQPLVELETDKATAELPAEVSGVIRDVLVKAGEEVKVGQTLLILDPQGDGASDEAAAAEPESAPEPEAEQEPEREPEPEPETTPEPESETQESAEEEESPAPEPEPAPSASEEQAPAPAPAKPKPVTTGGPADVAPAAPSIRRLARELGLDIRQVPGSGPGGRISEDDVMAFARQSLSGAPKPAAPAAEPATREAGIPSPSAEPTLPDFSPWGEVERERASKVRRVTARTMAQSWTTIPHVTQFDRADITKLDEWRREYGARVEKMGGKLTVTAIVVRILASAMKAFPKFNASYDSRNEEIVYKKFVNVGVAVDTEHGFLVPVIHNTDRKNITEIAVALGDLASQARERKIQPDELQGATINLSNLGGLGTTYFSPIIAWPQVAILGIGRGNTEAVWVDGKFEPRLILPLSVSYDHRIIDGADAARFLRWIAEALEQPLLMALEG